MSSRVSRFLLVLAQLLIWCSTSPAVEQFDLRDGDRVVLLGGAVIEQEQLSGYWETLLTIARPNAKITFRNLGWSGDTVWGESRGMFEPHLGYDRLVAHVKQEQPTLVIVAYGGAEAFGGEERIEAFAGQLARLIADLSAEDRRFVFVSPLLMEAAALPVRSGDAQQHAQTYNRNLVRYSDAIRRFALEHDHAYVDLQPIQIAAENGDTKLTDNGIRLTPAGYRRTARWLASNVAPRGNIARLAEVVDLDFETPAAAQLRQAVIAKNRLYFHRWRPQNFTYLYGFRKHEQGQNAVEIPQFDPLIAAAELTISQLADELLPPAQP